MNTKRISLILFIIVACINSNYVKGQSRFQNTRHTSSEAIVKAYSDSLSIYKAKIDSLMNANDSLRAEMGYPAENNYFRYFAPMAYYPDVVHNMFTMNSDAGDNTANGLMNIYLNRPDMVSFSASNFGKLAQTTKDFSTKENLAKRIELTQQVQEKEPVTAGTEEIAPEKIDMYVTKPHFWTFLGDYYLQLLQNYVSSNWYNSGSNSYSMLGTVTLQYNYNNKQKIKWDNKLELRLGFQTTEADTVNKFKPSDDLIRYTTKFGVQAHNNWYYTVMLMAYTKFAKGLKDNNDYVYSDFMSPLTIDLSLGMDYSVATKNKKLKGSVNISPLAFKFKYVDRKNLASSCGIKGNHRTSEDFGSQLTADLTWTPFNNFKWKMRLYAYTTYHKFLAEMENTISLQFNKYISTNLYLYPRFDDNVKRVDDNSYFQFKEYFSLGFSYSM